MMQALNNTLIGRIVPVDESPYGIYLPPVKGSHPTLFKVESVGSECKFVKQGDTVFVNEFSGRPFTYKKQRFYRIDESDVQLIID